MIDGIGRGALPGAVDSSRTPATPGGATATTRAGAAQAGTVRPTPAGAHVAGTAGGGVHNIVRDMAASAPVDAGRVAALRAEIAAGRYTIDADAIAGAMLRLEPRR